MFTKATTGTRVFVYEVYLFILVQVSLYVNDEINIEI